MCGRSKRSPRRSAFPGSGFSTPPTSGAAPRSPATRTARRGSRARWTGRSRGSAGTSRSPTCAARPASITTSPGPAMSGILTASAPGRFAAAINQAPLWRRTRKPWLRPYDLAANALRTWGIRHVPPDHLLREVFETCADFGAARRRLETTPVARPVIFTLVGCKRGECCVIERTEEGFASRDEDTSAANDWLRGNAPWEARVNAKLLLTARTKRPPPTAAPASEALAAWSTLVRAPDFRVGDPAGAQSVHPSRGRDVSGRRHASGRRLRGRAGQRAPAAGDAGSRAGNRRRGGKV